MSNQKAMYRTADILARTISGMFAGAVFSAGVVFCLETMVALSRDVDCGCSWRNASERVRQGPCSSAVALR
jgi:hypothetical protein